MDEHVEVAVSDTGVGIAPKDLEAVFEKFRQVGTAEKKAEGTGLGLALARKFIELERARPLRSRFRCAMATEVVLKVTGIGRAPDLMLSGYSSVASTRHRFLG